MGIERKPLGPERKGMSGTEKELAGNLWGQKDDRKEGHIFWNGRSDVARLIRPPLAKKGAIFWGNKKG